MKKEKTTIVVAGVLIGVISAMLVFFGNPANMGFCIACFLRRIFSRIASSAWCSPMISPISSTFSIDRI